MTRIERRLLDRLQEGFPLEERPFHRLARELGLSVEEVLGLTRELVRRGLIRRLGPIYDARALGYHSTLLGLEVAEEAFEEVARQVNAFPEVTHNYRRRGRFNCWCTVLAPSRERLRAVVERIGGLPGVRRVLDLPVLRRYKLRLAFTLEPAQEGRSDE